MALLLTEDPEVQFPLGGRADVEAAVTEDGTFPLEPALRRLGVELRAIGVIPGPDVGRGAVGELQPELQRLFDFLEEVRLGLRQLLGGHRDRIGVGGHAGGLDGIDAHVQERAAAGELLLDAPGMLAEREPVGGGDLQERAELLRLREADEFLVVRVVMQAIAEGEALAGLLTRGDHGVAVSDGGRHRLLADDVLAGAEGGDDVLGVDAGRRDHVDHIDRLVRGDLVPLVIRIDVGVSEAVQLGELLPLGARAGDRGDELHVLGLKQRGRELTVGVAT